MTRFEQIASAFPLHAQRIAECTYAAGRLDWLQETPECDQEDAGYALAGAFVWARSTEGREYWARLRGRS